MDIEIHLSEAVASMVCISVVFTVLMLTMVVIRYINMIDLIPAGNDEGDDE